MPSPVEEAAERVASATTAVVELLYTLTEEQVEALRGASPGLVLALGGLAYEYAAHEEAQDAEEERGRSFLSSLTAALAERVRGA